MKQNNINSDYNKAKEVFETLAAKKEVVIEVANKKLFRKYLNDFSRNSSNEYLTRSENENQLRIIRYK
jgi:hypothetical protein